MSRDTGPTGSLVPGHWWWPLPPAVTVDQHPVGTTSGTGAGAAVGATVGMGLGGPPGAIIGGAIGGVVGGVSGHGIAAAVNSDGDEVDGDVIPDPGAGDPERH